MKEKSKASTILRAFTQGEASQYIDTEILESRRAICATCPYNSVNAELSFADKLKSKLGDFCTLCGCFLKEKTSQPNEECAATMIGEEPKWNKVMVETNSKAFNLFNLSPDKMNVGLTEDKSAFQINFGKMESSHPKKKHVFEGAFDLLYPKGSDVQITQVTKSCSCVTPVVKNLDTKSTIEFSIDITYRKYFLKQTPTKKAITVYYTMNGKSDKVIINIDGVIVWI